jgi:hypothetical protein
LSTPISNRNPHALRLARRLAGLLLATSVVDACTLNDYSYLGAKRDAQITSAGQSARASGGSTSSVVGGTAGHLATPGGGTATSTAVTVGGQGQGGASAAGGTGPVVEDGGMAGQGETGGTPSTRTITGGGGGATIGGTTSSTRTTSIAGGGAVSTGGTSASGTTSVANGGAAEGGSGNSAGATTVSSGGIAAAGATISSGGIAAAGAAVSNGGTAGGAGIGGTTVATGGATPVTSCPGCAVLDVPFTAKGQSARYLMLFSPTVTVNERPATSSGGSGATVSNQGTIKARAYAPKLGNTVYQLFVQQEGGSYTMCFSEYLAVPPELTSSWVTLEWGLGNCSSDTSIGRLGVILLSSDDASAPTPTATTIWLDSLWIELNGSIIAGPFNFDSADKVNASAMPNDYDQTKGVLYLRPSGPPPPSGSTISWRSG